MVKHKNFVRIFVPCDYEKCKYKYTCDLNVAECDILNE